MRIERKTIKRTEDINKGDILTVLNLKKLMKMTEDPDYGMGFADHVKILMPHITIGMMELCGKKISISYIDHKKSIIRVKDVESGKTNLYNWCIKYFIEYHENN